VFARTRVEWLAGNPRRPVLWDGGDHEVPKFDSEAALSGFTPRQCSPLVVRVGPSGNNFSARLHRLLTLWHITERSSTSTSNHLPTAPHHPRTPLKCGVFILGPSEVAMPSSHGHASNHLKPDNLSSHIRLQDEANYNLCLFRSPYIINRQGLIDV
jgi:hypothetical protein